MTNTDFQQMILKVINYAQTNTQSKFRFICNWTEYRYFRGKRKAYKLFVNGLSKGANRLFKTYCKVIAEGSDNLNKLLAYQQMVQAVTFYRCEIDTINAMLSEYEAYLLDGNFLDSFLGNSRDESNLKDYRNED